MFGGRFSRQAAVEQDGSGEEDLRTEVGGHDGRSLPLEGFAEVVPRDQGVGGDEGDGDRMHKQNCWQVKQCGRQPGGWKIKELGVCPAAMLKEHDGTNGGRNAGRYCWRVSGSLCEGEVQGSWAEKMRACSRCDFFHRVQEEEGDAMVY